LARHPGVSRFGRGGVEVGGAADSASAVLGIGHTGDVTDEEVDDVFVSFHFPATESTDDVDQFRDATIR
jgi:hypothetical protein